MGLAAILTVGLLEHELLQADAVAVFESLPALGRNRDHTPLSQQGGR
jgi:hypothetical protein